MRSSNLKVITQTKFVSRAQTGAAIFSLTDFGNKYYQNIIVGDN